jgi:hypothetical protein
MPTMPKAVPGLRESAPARAPRTVQFGARRGEVIVSAREFREIARREKSKSDAAASSKRSVQLREMLTRQVRERGYAGEIRYEVMFHPTRKWRLDMFFPFERIAVEREGGIHGRKGARRCAVCGETPKGRHNTGKGFEQNVEKYNEARVRGIMLLQATPDQIESGRATGWIMRALAGGVNGGSKEVLHVRSGKTADGFLSTRQERASAGLQGLLTQGGTTMGEQTSGAHTRDVKAASRRTLRSRRTATHRVGVTTDERKRAK